MHQVLDFDILHWNIGGGALFAVSKFHIITFSTFECLNGVLRDIEFSRVNLLSCLACTDPSAVDIFVLDFGSLTEFARRALLREWLSVGSLGFSCRSSSWHQKHTPLRWPRTRSERPRRWTSITKAIISVRLSLMYERIRAAVAVSLTVVAVSASIQARSA